MRRAAFTVAEMLVVMALFSLVALAVVWALIPSMRWMLRHSTRAALETRALAVTTRLISELQTTSANAAGAHNGSGNDPTYLWMTPLIGLTTEGTTLWANHAIIYWWSPASQTLRRKEWPPAPPSLVLDIQPSYPLDLAPDEVRQILAESNHTEQQLAQDVVLWDVTLPPGSWEVPRTLTFRLQLRQDIQGFPLEVKIERSLYLRNAGNYQ